MLGLLKACFPWAEAVPSLTNPTVGPHDSCRGYWGLCIRGKSPGLGSIREKLSHAGTKLRKSSPCELSFLVWAPLLWVGS